jgi:hypothetical protein
MIDPGINSPQVNSAPHQVFFTVRTITKIIEIGKEESGGMPYHLYSKSYEIVGIVVYSKNIVNRNLSCWLYHKKCRKY